jgi:SOUL heme-binding protein
MSPIYADKRTLVILIAFGLVALLFFEKRAIATEEPKYKITLQQSAIEIRDYPALLAAEVMQLGTREEAMREGFRILAEYITGANISSSHFTMPAQNNMTGVQIAMTAPVLQMGEPNAWTIRFIMPSGYSLTTVPVPQNPQVHLLNVNPTRMAVIRFSGLGHEADIVQYTQELRDFIQAQHLTAVATPILARYNPPWTLWFLRRNEIMMEVQAVSLISQRMRPSCLQKRYTYMCANVPKVVMF